MRIVSDNGSSRNFHDQGNVLQTEYKLVFWCVPFGTLHQLRAIQCRFLSFTLWLTGPEPRAEEECVRIRSGTAYGGIEAENPKTDSPFSRTEAIHLIRSLLDEQSRKMLRVLLCFDFAFGFPRDFSAALQTATGKTDSALP